MLDFNPQKGTVNMFEAARLTLRLFLFAAIFCLAAQTAIGSDVPALESKAGPPVETAPDLTEILTRLEERYAVIDFSASFVQHSTLKAMDITDTATGKIFIKKPGKIRWEYHAPDRQIIVSDGAHHA